MNSQEETLAILRKQLQIAIEFMHETPAPPGSDPIYDAEHWQLHYAGSFPAYPKEYHPVEWQMTSFSIESLWDEYLSLLKDYGMMERYETACQLEIADLMDWTSEKWSEEYDA